MKHRFGLHLHPVDPHAFGRHAWAVAEAIGCFALSGAVGLGAALWLRRAGLKWSWGLASVPVPLALLWVAISGFAPVGAILFPLALSAGFASGTLGLAVFLELEDRRSGADREAQARRRRGVLDTLRRRLKERKGIPAHALAKGLPIGRDARGELAFVPRGSARSGAHVLIPGATGAGKTTSLAALLVEYVVRSGFGVVVLEAKTDAALSEAAQAAAEVRGVPFRLISPEGPCGYDPLADGNVDERSERLLAAQGGWGSEDAQFYRQASSPFLRLVLRALVTTGEPLSLSTVARRCDPDELENLRLELSDGQLAEEIAAELKGLRADERRALAGLQARLRNLASSRFAARWLHRSEGIHTVALRRAIRDREVVYFRLDTDRTGNVGRAIAQIALLDLGAVASAMMDAGVGTFVAIDEYGALAAPALERLFTRARAAGFSVALGTQTLADLRAAGPAVPERVGATTSAVICHRLGGQADAEWVAQLIGTVPTWETTIRTDGWGLPTRDGTRTRGYRFEVNPAELQRLGSGEAYVARFDRPAVARAAKVRVVPAWERLPPSAAQAAAGSQPDPALTPFTPSTTAAKAVAKGETMNSVALVGRLTADPQMKQNGEQSICEMRIAETGAPKRSPLYIDVAAFGRQAENCQRYLSTGRHVAVFGQLRYEEWRGEGGEKRFGYSIKAERVEFLDDPRATNGEEEARED